MSSAKKERAASGGGCNHAADVSRHDDAGMALCEHGAAGGIGEFDRCAPRIEDLVNPACGLARFDVLAVSMVRLEDAAFRCDDV